MMRFCLLLVAAIAVNLPSVEAPDSLARVPILHDGRVKPLDSVARHWLLVFNSRSSVAPETEGDDKLAALPWFVELLSGSERSDQRRVFRVDNPAVTDRLGLEPRSDFRWTFAELQEAIGEHEDEVAAILHKSQDDQLLPERQLADLHQRMVLYRRLTLSTSCLVPQFAFRSPTLAERYGLAAEKPFSLAHLLQRNDRLHADLRRLSDQLAQRQELQGDDLELFQIAMVVEDLRKRSDTLLTLIPPAGGADAAWHGPWEVLGDRTLPPANRQLLEDWSALFGAWLAADQPAIDRLSNRLLTDTLAVSGADTERLAQEVQYNRSGLFGVSVACYILALLFLACSAIGWRRGLGWAAFAALGVGLAVHSYGIGLRIMIMDRPPVGNLYESIIFVAAVTALFGVVGELILRNRIFTFLGAQLALTLQLVGFGYADDGDSMGMLVAVLNSRFWLMTHVLTITIGYGIAYGAAVLGHLALVVRGLSPRDRAVHAHLDRLCLAAALIALFFTLFGTILGGIWADQSWGRFWGWDPKENGALWIVLWLLFLLHARMAGLIKATGFAVGLVLVAIVVTLAWFGVNLLGVGLHSYGFTDSILVNLAAYTAVQLILAAGLYSWARIRLAIAGEPLGGAGQSVTSQ